MLFASFSRSFTLTFVFPSLNISIPYTLFPSHLSLLQWPEHFSSPFSFASSPNSAMLSSCLPSQYLALGDCYLLHSIEDFLKDLPIQFLLFSRAVSQDTLLTITLRSLKFTFLKLRGLTLLLNISQDCKLHQCMSLV